MRNALLGLLFLLAAPAAASGFQPPCFDGASCLEAALGMPEPARPVPLAPLKPVVISIVGVDFTEVGLGKLELRYFKEILEFFKPGAKIDESAFRGRMAAVGEDEQLNELYKRQPDDYLDARLASVLPAGRYEIVPVRWSRDPDESAAALPLVEKELKRIFTKARSDGRPVYLVAHSWGSVLAHTALHRLAKSDPQLRVERLVTLGSPLVPASWWMEIFMKHQISQGQLQAYVAKPANTAYWVNLWARNDWFSNEIKAADRNLLEDGMTVPLVSRVKAAAEQDHSLRPEALRDLFLLKSIKTWHFAYIFDFGIFLKTLREYHERRIFEPVITSELAY